MMKLKMFMSAILIIISLFLHSQSFPSSYGGRAVGMGYCSIVNEDFWATFNNQGAAAGQELFKAGIFMENHFLMSEMNRIALGIFVPLYKGGICTSIEHFGGDIYSELKAGLGYSMQFGEKFSAGIQLDYMRLAVGEGHGSYQAISFEGGILAEITDKIALGVHCFNPISVKWDNSEDRIPIVIKAGLGIKAGQALKISAEIVKSSVNKAVIMTGCEYSFQKKFFLRAGITSGPARYTFGAGYRSNRLVIDIASSVHAYLGYSPQLSFTYTAGK